LGTNLSIWDWFLIWVFRTGY